MTRKEAAEKVYELQKAMEYKPFAFSTVYRKIIKLNNGNWHFSGIAYDYTV